MTNAKSDVPKEEQPILGKLKNTTADNPFMDPTAPSL